MIMVWAATGVGIVVFRGRAIMEFTPASCISTYTILLLIKNYAVSGLFFQEWLNYNWVKSFWLLAGIIFELTAGYLIFEKEKETKQQEAHAHNVTAGEQIELAERGRTPGSPYAIRSYSPPKHVP
eukprot:UN23441